MRARGLNIETDCSASGGWMHMVCAFLACVLGLLLGTFAPPPPDSAFISFATTAKAAVDHSFNYLLTAAGLLSCTSFVADLAARNRDEIKIHNI